jgi:hypothetical protein
MKVPPNLNGFTVLHHFPPWFLSDHCARRRTMSSLFGCPYPSTEHFPLAIPSLYCRPSRTHERPWLTLHAPFLL